MLRLAVSFLVVAVVVSLFGFGNIAGTASEVARWLLVIFIGLFVITLAAGDYVGKKVIN
ncbi:MAG: DUF1328 domain-containing protein [Burkholderiales bacterium]|nr:DUF1328 domain-containing protein [Anaerolineae bacterium]